MVATRVDDVVSNVVVVMVVLAAGVAGFVVGTTEVIGVGDGFVVVVVVVPVVGALITVIPGLDPEVVDVAAVDVGLLGELGDPAVGPGFVTPVVEVCPGAEPFELELIVVEADPLPGIVGVRRSVVVVPPRGTVDLGPSGMVGTVGAIVVLVVGGGGRSGKTSVVGGAVGSVGSVAATVAVVVTTVGRCSIEFCVTVTAAVVVGAFVVGTAMLDGEIGTVGGRDATVVDVFGVRVDGGDDVVVGTWLFNGAVVVVNSRVVVAAFGGTVVAVVTDLIVVDGRGVVVGLEGVVLAGAVEGGGGTVVGGAVCVVSDAPPPRRSPLPSPFPTPRAFVTTLPSG